MIKVFVPQSFVGFEPCDLRQIVPPKGVLLSALVWRFRVVPVEESADRVVFATDDLQEIDTIDTLHHLFGGREVVIKAASSEDVDWAMETFFGPGKEEGLRRRAISQYDRSHGIGP